jgi:hypothetical protein
MARVIQRLAINVIAERDIDTGVVTTRLGAINFVVVETGPPTEDLYNTTPLVGRIGGPAFVGTQTLNQLLLACQNIVKQQGNVP